MRTFFGSLAALARLRASFLRSWSVIASSCGGSAIAPPPSSREASAGAGGGSAGSVRGGLAAATAICRGGESRGETAVGAPSAAGFLALNEKKDRMER